MFPKSNLILLLTENMILWFYIVKMGKVSMIKKEMKTNYLCLKSNKT